MIISDSPKVILMLLHLYKSPWCGLDMRKCIEIISKAKQWVYRHTPKLSKLIHYNDARGKVRGSIKSSQCILQGPWLTVANFTAIHPNHWCQPHGGLPKTHFLGNVYFCSNFDHNSSSSCEVPPIKTNEESIKYPTWILHNRRGQERIWPVRLFGIAPERHNDQRGRPTDKPRSTSQ